MKEVHEKILNRDTHREYIQRYFKKSPELFLEVANYTTNLILYYKSNKQNLISKTYFHRENPKFVFLAS